MLALAAIPLMGFVGAAVDLQPRRFGAHRHAGGARCDRADAVEGRPEPDAAPTSTRRPPTISTRMFNRPEAHERPGHPAVQRAAAGQLHAQADRQRHRRHRVHQAARPVADQLLRHRRSALGHQEAQPRAGARQHRLDGVERQDDRRSRPPRTICSPRCRTPRRRPATSRSRSCRSPSTSMSAPATSTRPGSTGPTGRPPTAPAAAAATQRKAAASRNGKIWTPKPPQHLERLRQRPRPEQRRQQHRDRLPAARRPCTARIRPRTARPR